MSRGESSRSRLLAAAIDDVAANGVGDRSLRQIATALGTSHRMLIYHFGSKEGLFVEIVRAVEQRQRELLAELKSDDDAGLGDIARRMWDHLADPAMWPYERLFFEMYGRALQGDAAASSLLDDIVEVWIEPLAAAIEHDGAPGDDARARARLGVAVGRGLLLDLLATGDRAAVDAAMEQFITMYEAQMITSR